MTMHRRAWLGGCASMLLLAGCNPTREEPPAEEDDAGPLLWPGPPAPARFMLEFTIRRSTDIELPRQDAALQGLLGVAPDEGIAFGKPYDVAAWRGLLYVSDTVERLVHVFNVPARRFFQLGYRREGRLTKPLGVDVDRVGRVYVADVSSRHVVVYDRLGLWQRFLGAEEDLVRPTAVAARHDGNRVYVVDTGGVATERHRVVAYDGEGRRLYEIGPRGTEPGRFNLPTDAAVDPAGNLYVLDAGNFRVQVFDGEGRFLRAFGELGARPGQLARPRGIAVDDGGRVFISDGAFGNVQVFDPEGRLLLAIGATGGVDEAGRYALPAGIDVDETGRLYLLDQLFLKLDVIRPVDAAAS